MVEGCEGNWITDVRGMCEVVREYFDSLFKIECNGSFEPVLDQILQCITSDMNLAFGCQVMDKEILDSFNQIDSRKALGIDGLLGLFYKEN